MLIMLILARVLTRFRMGSVNLLVSFHESCQKRKEEQVASVKRWRDLLDPGNMTIFTVGALNSNKQSLSGKQQRQISFISEYISEIVNVAGKDNVVADSFSRVASRSTQAQILVSLISVSYTHLTLPTIYSV